VEPINLHHRKPEDRECVVLRYGHHVTRHCWFGSQIYEAGIVRWHWKWTTVPDTVNWRGVWPLTHWLPADVEMLPAIYSNNGTDSPSD